MENQTIEVQRSVFALETMEEVLLVKETEFVPVSDNGEALKRLGGDTAKFLAVINAGLKDETRRALISDPAVGWMQEDEEGNKTPFSGTIADKKTVNTLQLTLAKTVFQYSKDAAVDEKRKAKADALDMIRSTPKLLEGLQRSAAISE